MDELALHGDDSMEFLVNDELFCDAWDLTVPARPDSRMDMRQGQSGLRPKPDVNDDEVMNQDDDTLEEKEDKTSGLGLGALERDLLEYQFSEEDEEEEVDEHLLLMTPFSFISHAEEAPANLSPMDAVGLALGSRSRGINKLLNESTRRRRIDDTMRVIFMGTLPEEE